MNSLEENREMSKSKRLSSKSSRSQILEKQGEGACKKGTDWWEEEVSKRRSWSTRSKAIGRTERNPGI